MTKGVCVAHGGDLSVSQGGTNRIRAYVKALLDAGIDVVLVIPEPKGSLPSEFDDAEVRTVKPGIGPFTNQVLRGMSIVQTSRETILETGYDLQIHHSLLAGLATVVGVNEYVLIMHDLAHDSPIFDELPFEKAINGLLYHLERRGVQKAADVAVVSNRMKRFVVEEWGLNPEKVHITPSGYFKKEYSNMDFDNIEMENNLIVFLGSLHPKFDVEKVISLAKALEEDKNIEIIGDGEMREKLEKEVVENSISNLTLRGRLPYPKAIRRTAQAQVAIMPQQPSLTSELSSPAKLIEYAALGLPIVADNVAELCEKLSKNDAALVSDPQSTDQFIRNVKSCMEESSTRNILRENARKFVTNYQWENISKDIVDIYLHE